MNSAIKVLNENIESLEMRIDLGKEVYPLVDDYKKELPELKKAVKLLSISSNDMCWIIYSLESLEIIADEGSELKHETLPNLINKLKNI